MAWFKVDDGLHSHPKVADAGEAIALWVLAGSWCARHLTDGWVPAGLPNRLIDKGTEYAEGLVAAGLWRPAERDGRSGWCFHDWHDMQPTAEQVRAERAASAERQRRWRERRHGARNASQAPSTNAATDGVSTTVSDAPTNGVKTVSPTRPDPTTTPNGVVRVGGRRDSEWKPEDDPDFKNRVNEQIKERMGDRKPAITPTRQAAVQEMRARLSGKANDGV